MCCAPARSIGIAATPFRRPVPWADDEFTPVAGRARCRERKTELKEVSSHVDDTTIGARFGVPRRRDTDRAHARGVGGRSRPPRRGPATYFRAAPGPHREPDLQGAAVPTAAAVGPIGGERAGVGGRSGLRSLPARAPLRSRTPRRGGGGVHVGAAAP